MPRRSAAIIPGIPLFLVDSVVRQELKAAGEELLRIVIRKVRGHLYEISVRTRSICRKLHPPVPQAGIPNIFEVPV
jgi:hypothetical protein